jgi:hypothetical protein
MTTTISGPQLLMDTSLNEMLSRYLENKPYKMVKPVVEAIKRVERKNPNTGEDMVVWAISREATVYLLNEIMGKEEMIRAYMFIRQGYERDMALEAEAAKRAVEEPKSLRVAVQPVPEPETEPGNLEDVD